jgi:hypothetical protein
MLYTLAVSPGGQVAFVSSAYFGPSDRVYVLNPESGEVQSLTVYGAPYSQPQWAVRPTIP